ncbi:MAG TPA: hypothetical protein PK385_06775 [Spirochaetota bacterium]|nr:hypothetical protein [Spirochaetota bacterium]HOS32965.1 hypothetical protein [Spirochaetota bacterium]HOS55746.1 hypothetical protein [Spirochaetota bacterium]HQF78360.1 hypothetical protein [Spirochaetota bacterium]HQH30357.1 hypothetical protein [Spirochaetota bacterium]
MSKLKILLALLIISSSYLFPEKLSYFCRYTSDKKVLDNQRITVDKNAYNVEIDIFLNGSLTYRSSYDAELNQLSALHYSSKNAPILNVNFDNVAMKMNVLNRKSFDIEKFTLVNNPTIFYIFQEKYPKTVGDKIIMYLYQTDQNIIYQIYVKNLGIETISLDNQTIDTIKVEMGLTGFPGILWPFKYHYWFNKDSNMFVKYTGTNTELKTDTIEVNRYIIE